MSRARITSRNLATVLIKFAAWALAEPEDGKKLVCADLNDLLDRYAGEDAFGTEGQCDPRGDQRD